VDCHLLLQARRGCNHTDYGNLNKEISALTAGVTEQSAVITSEQWLKLLYSGTGDDLVSVVGFALRELGLQVVEGPRRRADLLVWDGSRLAAAEVKGLDGTAREANHRQAVRWAADVNACLSATPEDRKQDSDLERYAEKLTELGLNVSSPINNLECRGLMIINTFRQTPLHERNSDSYPDPVVRAIARSNVCALTGLDLYCLLKQAREEPSKKSEVTDILLSSLNGVLAAIDWREFIRVQEH
jgi:hypothetical protein